MTPEEKKARQRLYVKNWKKRNAAKVKDDHARWQTENREAVYKKHAEWRDKNRKALNERAAKYRAENPEKVKASQKRWAHRNRKAKEMTENIDAFFEKAATIRDAYALLTQEELALLIGVYESTLMFWRKQGKGPSFAKLGQHIFYRRADVEAWIAANVRSFNAPDSAPTS